MVGDKMRSVIVYKFSMGDRFRPGHGIIAAEDLEIGLDFLVYSFRFAVCLWVISS